MKNIFFKLYSQCLHKAPMENLVKIGSGNSKWVVLQSSSCHLPTSVTPQGSQDCPRPPEAQMKAQCSWLVVLLCYCIVIVISCYCHLLGSVVVLMLMLFSCYQHLVVSRLLPSPVFIPCLLTTRLVALLR